VFSKSNDLAAHEKTHKEQVLEAPPCSLSNKDESISYSNEGSCEYSAELGHLKGRCLESEIDAAISGIKEKNQVHKKSVLMSTNTNETNKNYFVNNYDFLSRTGDVFKVKKIFKNSSRSKEEPNNDRKRQRHSSASQIPHKHSVQKVTENTKEASEKKTFKITKNSEKSYVHKDSPEYDTD